MEEKKELNLSDAQLEEIAGGLNKQQIKDAAGKVIKFGKNNVKEILLATTAVTNAAALAIAFNTNKKLGKLSGLVDKYGDEDKNEMSAEEFGLNILDDEEY